MWLCVQKEFTNERIVSTWFRNNLSTKSLFYYVIEYVKEGASYRIRSQKCVCTSQHHRPSTYLFQHTRLFYFHRREKLTNLRRFIYVICIVITNWIRRSISSYVPIPTFIFHYAFENYIMKCFSSSSWFIFRSTHHHISFMIQKIFCRCFRIQTHTITSSLHVDTNLINKILSMMDILKQLVFFWCTTFCSLLFFSRFESSNPEKPQSSRIINWKSILKSKFVITVTKNYTHIHNLQVWNQNFESVKSNKLIER